MKNNIGFSTDILVFSVSTDEKENYRKLGEKHFAVLLVKNEDGKWCLPNREVTIDMTSYETARTALKEQTNIKNIYLEQLYTYDDVDRIPDRRTVSIAFIGLVDKNRVSDSLPNNVSWFDMTIDDNEKFMSVILESQDEELQFKIQKVLREFTKDRYEYIIKKSDLAYDHARIIAAGISRLKNKIMYTDIVFNMMPEYFTLKDLQKVYEVILGKKLLDPAFRRVIADKVYKTDKLKIGDGHRPSALYKYKDKNERD